MFSSFKQINDVTARSYAASCLERTETESARTSTHISLTLSLAENSHVCDFFNTKFSGYFFKIAKLKRYQKVLFFFFDRLRE